MSILWIIGAILSFGGVGFGVWKYINRSDGTQARLDNEREKVKRYEEEADTRSRARLIRDSAKRVWRENRKG